MDNYYTSPELFSELDLLNTYACGTVRTNRKGVPKAFSAVKRMKQGDGIFRRKGNLLAVKFHDKRDIHMLTTFHEAKLLVTDRVNKNNEPVVKPNTIIDYCKYMGGVDVNDQICQYYEVLRKCVKGWKLYFFTYSTCFLLTFTSYIGNMETLQRAECTKLSDKILYVH